MKLVLQRGHSSTKSTIGELFRESRRLCYTLEDVVRETKVLGITAIPAGTYQIVLTFSNRFQRVLPELLNVPGYTGVRIHPGNRPEDTEGCILPGLEKGFDVVTHSRQAFEIVFGIIKAALEREKVYIEVRNP